MADTADAPAASAASTPKRGKSASKPKKSKVAPSHPKVSEMVNSAISSLKERGGSSLQAIKKYIGSHYKVDIERLSPFIKKYLKSAVASGALVQTKGKGATGSFRMSATGGGAGGKPKEVVKPKPTRVAPKKPKVVARKAVAVKPKAAKKSTPAAKKPKPKAAKSPKKAKASKPKTPKPKKAKAAVKKTPAKKGGRK